jgi:hypothetical protein
VHRCRCAPREVIGEKRHGGLLIGIDHVISGNAHSDRVIDRAGHGRLIGDAGIDGFVLVGREVFGKSDVDDLDVIVRVSAFLECLVECGGGSGTGRRDGNLHAF